MREKNTSSGHNTEMSLTSFEHLEKKIHSFIQILVFVYLQCKSEWKILKHCNVYNKKINLYSLAYDSSQCIRQGGRGRFNNLWSSRAQRIKYSHLTIHLLICYTLLYSRRTQRVLLCCMSLNYKTKEISLFTYPPANLFRFYLRLSFTYYIGQEFGTNIES